MNRKARSSRRIVEAQASIKRSEEMLSAIRSRADEINQIVWRLHLREVENHFGESLMIAMGRK